MSTQNATGADREQTITYELSVTVTRPVRLYDLDSTLDETAEWMKSREAQRELERELLRALRVLDGDCDVEVLRVQS